MFAKKRRTALQSGVQKAESNKLMSSPAKCGEGGGGGLRKNSTKEISREKLTNKMGVCERVRKIESEKDSVS